MQQTRKQLIDYLVSRDPHNRTTTMIEDILRLAMLDKGRKSIVQQTGYGDKTVRKVLQAYRAWEVAYHGADAVAAVIGRDSSSVATEDDASEPDGKEWLFSDDVVWNSDTDVYITFLSSSPKPLVVPGAKHRALKQAYSNWSTGKGATVNELCRMFGMPRAWTVEYIRKHGWTHDSEPFTDEEIAARPVDELIDDALQLKKLALHQGYEKRKWAEIKKDADSWNKWNEIEKPKLLEAITASARKAPPTIAVKPSEQEPFAAFCSPFNDLHWGKLSHPAEVRSPYNRQIAEARIFSAVERLIQDVLRTGVPDVWLIPVGGDLLHIDGPNHTTTAGTRQDVDGTFREISRSCNAMVVQVIEMFLQVAPVQLYPERGNHDEVASFNIGEYLTAYFRNDDRVMVNQAMQERQYAVYGTTLIGISHGDKSKPDALARKLMSEVRHLYTKTDHHIIFTAHLHSIYAQEVDGILVMRRPCLSGTDIWHEQSAYTGNAVCVTSMFISKERGPYHHLLASPTRGI